MNLKSIVTIVFMILFSLNNAYSQTSMPNINIKTLEGKTINSKTTYNKKGLTVYSFWATWCVPCINELDDIHNLEDKPTSMEKTPPKTPSSKKKSIEVERKRTGLPTQPNALRRSWLQEQWIENTNEKDSFVDFSVSKPLGEDDLLNEAEDFMTKK